MNKATYILKAVLVLTICFISCEKNNEVDIDQTNLLIGSWSDAVYDNETIVFKRVKELPQEDYGVSFKNTGLFIERSSGFCGTPPLVFFNSEGKWTSANETIYVEVESFVGKFNWKILKLTQKELIVQRELTEQEKDHRDLMNLFDEILSIANSKDCINSEDWKIVAYGAKPCGGPRGYLAYHIEIKEGEFLQKIETYTNEEEKYNLKWGIVSTCDVIPQPTSVECQNKKPVLKY
ncbi:conserved protein of unknown function [Tenacibaculum sp. 190130A14a]|uniref:Lipocalin-like domain-containing protein n=1 Tax=Tenacibaculum polynesiense TaxID=3137857 RepID=A0ABM9P9K7_9FLAO